MTIFCLDIRNKEEYDKLRYKEAVNIPFDTLKNRSYELPERFSFQQKNLNNKNNNKNLNSSTQLDKDEENSLVVFYSNKENFNEAKTWLHTQGYTLIYGVDLNLIDPIIENNENYTTLSKMDFDKVLKLATDNNEELNKIIKNNLIINSKLNEKQRLKNVLWKPCPLFEIYNEDINKALLSIKNDDNSTDTTEEIDNNLKIKNEEANKLINKPFKFLDLGCGCGRDTIYMATHFNCIVTSIDRTGTCNENEINIYSNKDINIEKTNKKLVGCLKNCDNFCKDYNVRDKVTIIDGNIRSEKVCKELESRGKFDLVILSRFPYSQEIYKMAASHLRTGGLFLIHQFSTNTYERFHKPRKSFCINYDMINKVALQKTCKVCKKGLIGKKCLDYSKCGFGMEKELGHCYTTTTDGRECLSCIYIKGPE